MPDGRNDGRVTVVPFQNGYFPAGGGNPYASAMQMFAQMNRAAGSPQGMQQGLFRAMMLGALANMITSRQSQGSQGSSGGSPFVDWAGLTPAQMQALQQQAQAMGFGGGANGGNVQGFGGGQFGPFQPGGVGPTQGQFGMGPTDGSDTSAVLNDPSLTVEDKVTLMIMLIMKQMDKEIERQAQAIDQLQKQQNKQGGGGGGKGGKGGGGGGGGDKSIDVETMKLKRLIDKRSQMFDMLRQIIDKYNQTAKGIIDSIGR